MSVLSGLPPETLSDLKPMMSEKASVLFAICDQEDKGFVTKRDMQRMRAELPLGPEQLEAVFDQLDGDGNGYLTLKEFTEGFGEYLGIESKSGTGQGEGDNEEKEVKVEKKEEDVEPDEENEFNVLLGELGLLGLVDDDQPLRDMWLSLRHDGATADVANFEQLLTQLARDLQAKTSEQEQLEHAVKSRSHLQEEHLQRLYEEMDAQIGAERRQHQEEEERREQQLRQQWQQAMQLKDQQLQDVMTRTRELERELEETKKSVLPTMQEENAHLAKERDRLQMEVDRQKILHNELAEQMQSLRHETKSERRQRAKAALAVSETIAQEREGIVQQLDYMKALNAKILDERDSQVNEAIVSENNSLCQGVRMVDDLKRQDNAEQFHGSDEGEGPRADQKQQLQQVSDLMRGIMGPESNSMLMAPPPLALDLATTSEYEYDDDYFANGMPEAANGVTVANAAKAPGRRRPEAAPRTRPRYQKMHSVDNVSLHEELASVDSSRGAGKGGNSADSSSASERSSTISKNPRRHKWNPQDARFSSSILIYHNKQQQQPRQSEPPEDSVTSCTGPLSYGESDLISFNTSSVNTPNHYVQPLSQVKHQVLAPYEPVRLPERVFKVIFIGDSNVGKSSLIARFCTGKFACDLKSTVGVDFHTRSLLADGQSVCLQCWDTAGQERYRAITKQYFRKSDAVVVVYDISCERTFLNAREWLESAVDGAGEHATLMLLGNKLDLADDDLVRKVRKNEGLQLSRQFSTLFGEVSAADGRNVEGSLLELAKLLREREDLDIQKALKLSLEKSPPRGKSKCCGGQQRRD